MNNTFAEIDPIPSAVSVLPLYFPFAAADNARLYAAVSVMDR
jgi:hypothetical protein